DTSDLEHHAPGLDDGHPVVWCALAATHAGFGWFRGCRPVREDANPHFAAALQMVGDRAARCLDLPRGDPGGLQGLQAELTELDLIAGIRLAAHTAAVRLAVLHTLRL